MSIRHEILSALADGGKSMNDLMGGMPGETRHRLNDNVAQAIKDGMIEKDRNESSGLFEYSLTASGKARLDAGENKHIAPHKPVAKPAAGAKSKPSAASKISISGKPVNEAAGDSLRRENALAKVLDEIDQLTVTLNYQDVAMPPADDSLLASANRMLSDRLAGVAHALRGSGLPALANIDDGEDMQQHVAALTGAYQMALANRAKPLFWAVFGGNAKIHCDDEQDARKQAELLALQDGAGYVCAVVAECTAEVTWKEAA